MSNNGAMQGGTGWDGTVGGIIFFFVALILYIQHGIWWFFLALCFIGIGSIWFMCGKQAREGLGWILQILFSSKHPSAAADRIELIEKNLGSEATGENVRKELERIRKAIDHALPPEQGLSEITVDFHKAHEKYSYFEAAIEHTANSMPLFGLIGTLIEMVSIFGSLSRTVDIGTLGPQVMLAFGCTMWGAVISAIMKMFQARLRDRIINLEYDMERLEFQYNSMLRSRSVTTDMPV
jgi:biopolymer transport protein ExbB/TolQ